MKLLRWVLLGSAMGIAATGGARAADLPTTKPPAAPAAKPCFDSFYDYMNSTPKDCPLSWNGITLRG